MKKTAVKGISKFIFSNLCIIGSIAMIAVSVLDWFNPYMDFAGHAGFILCILCVSAAGLGLETLFERKRG
nr:hypothetical protein [uncultured Lachnoclostridium sp.]